MNFVANSLTIKFRWHPRSVLKTSVTSARKGMSRVLLLGPDIVNEKRQDL